MIEMRLEEQARRARLEGHIMEGSENHENLDLCLVCKRLNQGSDSTRFAYRKGNFDSGLECRLEVNLEQEDLLGGWKCEDLNYSSD